MADADFIASKVCKTCSIEKPLSHFYKAACCKDGLRGECKPCVSSKQAKYNQEHAEEISARKKALYYADGAEVDRVEKNAAYYRANQERLKQSSRKRHALNAAKISERRKLMRGKLHAQTMAWRSENRERVKEAGRAWYQKNKDRLRPSRKTAKAMRRAAGAIDAGVVEFLMKVQRSICPACRATLAKGNYHLDHIKPLARGGTNHKTNLQLLCPPCNLSKSAKDPIDFMQSKGFLL